MPIKSRHSKITIRKIAHAATQRRTMKSHRTLFLALLLTPLHSLEATAVPEPKPNVLMIAVDDLNDYVSVLQNHPGIKTPNLDRLAKRSLNFTRAFCAAPLCNPTRVAVATGMAPHQTGIYELKDFVSKSPPAMAAVSLEEQFKRHGYDTYLTGKYYHAGPPNWWPQERMARIWTQRKPPFSDHGPILKQGNEVMDKGVYAIGPAPGGFASMPDVAILNNIRGWLAAKHDKPFFMVQGISKPHLSFVVPKDFFDLYPLDSLVLPETPGDDYSDLSPTLKSKLLVPLDVSHFAKIQASGNGWKQVMQAYLASISFFDWVLGQTLDALEASPYANNTIIVLWSDNGYHIGEKEKLHKRSLWTQTARIPLLISMPGMKTAGRNCAAPVTLMDLLPTLNEVCGLDQKVPQELAGHSLAPLLAQPDANWPHVAVTSNQNGNAAVSDARYRYIRYSDGSEELYDNSTDPREYHNLAKQPDLKPVVERLSAALPTSWKPSPSKQGKDL